MSLTISQVINNERVRATWPGETEDFEFQHRLDYFWLLDVLQDHVLLRRRLRSLEISK